MSDQPLGPVSQESMEYVLEAGPERAACRAIVLKLRASEQAALLENAQLKDANTMLHAELEKLGDNATRRLKHLQGENEVLRRKHRGHRAHIYRMQIRYDRQSRELEIRNRHVNESVHLRNVEIMKRQAAEAEVARLKAALQDVYDNLTASGPVIDLDVVEAHRVAQEALTHGR